MGLTDWLRDLCLQRAVLGFFLLSVLFVAACDSGGGGTDDTDQTPTVENPIQDQNANANGAPIEVDLSPVFSNPSTTSLNYTASSSNASAVDVSISDSMLTVTPGSGGEGDVTVTASNDAGEASDTFTVLVFADPPDRP